MDTEKLIEVLRKRDVDGKARVMVTWEGTTHDLSQDNIYIAIDGRLIIDADDNHYKERFVNGNKNPGQKVV